jgi:hypothetical protein
VSSRPPKITSRDLRDFLLETPDRFEVSPLASPTTPLTPEEAGRTGAVALVGHLSVRPELRKTKAGRAYSVVRLEVDEGFGPELIDVVVWDMTAETLCRLRRQGDLLEVRGVWRDRTWTDREGVDHTTTDLHADRVTYLRSFAVTDVELM